MNLALGLLCKSDYSIQGSDSSSVPKTASLENGWIIAAVKRRETQNRSRTLSLVHKSGHQQPWGIWDWCACHGQKDFPNANKPPSQFPSSSSIIADEQLSHGSCVATLLYRPFGDLVHSDHWWTAYCYYLLIFPLSQENGNHKIWEFSLGIELKNIPIWIFPLRISTFFTS